VTSWFQRFFQMQLQRVPLQRGVKSTPVILFAAVAEITAMTCLCAYYLSWASSFATFTLVVGAVDHRSGLERGVSGGGLYKLTHPVAP
jgi:hypothetical protein